MARVFVAQLSIILAALAAVPAVAAEASEPVGRWLVHDIGGSQHATALPAYFEFKSGRVYGFDGCNYVQFNYKVDVGQKIKFDASGVASTLMACLGGNDVLAQKWAVMIAKVDGYEMASNAIYLLDGDKRLATLVKPDERVVGVRWRVRGFVEGDAVTIKAGPSDIWIMMKPDGSVVGEGPCSSIVGVYRMNESGDRVMLNVRSASTARCSGDAGALRGQNHFVEAINASSQSERTGNTVKFMNNDGHMTMLVSDDRAANQDAVR